MPPALEPPSTQPELLYVVLTPQQAERLNPVIDRHRKATVVTGLLCAITRSFDAPSGGIVMQLQLLPLNRRIAAVINCAAKGGRGP
jgi:hypothetical protein